MRVVAIDPGIVAVGIVDATVEWGDDGSVLRVVAFHDVAVVDVTKWRSEVLGRRHVHDYICVLLETYADSLAAASAVLVEAQAPGCAGVPLEIVLRERFGGKCVIVPPATLLAHRGVAGLDYDARKLANVAAAVVLAEGEWLGVPGATKLSALLALGKDAALRVHDAADAALLLHWFTGGMGWRTKYAKHVQRPLVTPASAGFAAVLEEFRWKGEWRALQSLRSRATFG